MKDVESVVIDFLNTIEEDWLYNPDCYTEAEAKEIAEYAGHPVYAWSLTYDEFANAFDHIPTVCEMMNWVINNCHEVRA